VKAEILVTFWGLLVPGGSAIIAMAERE